MPTNLNIARLTQAAAALIITLVTVLAACSNDQPTETNQPQPTAGVIPTAEVTPTAPATVAPGNVSPTADIQPASTPGPTAEPGKTTVPPAGEPAQTPGPAGEPEPAETPGPTRGPQQAPLPPIEHQPRGMTIFQLSEPERDCITGLAGTKEPDHSLEQLLEETSMEGGDVNALVGCLSDSFLISYWTTSVTGTNQAVAPETQDCIEERLPAENIREVLTGGPETSQVKQEGHRMTGAQIGMILVISCIPPEELARTPAGAGVTTEAWKEVTCAANNFLSQAQGSPSRLFQEIANEERLTEMARNAAIACGLPAPGNGNAHIEIETGDDGHKSPRAMAVRQAHLSTPARGLPPEAGGLQNPNDQPYPLVYYENHGVNPFVDTDEDPLSTFALDGDTGSYNIAGQYMKDGNVPDPDSVRVEEWINAFPQGYTAQGAGLSLHLDGGPSPFGEPGYKLLRVGVSTGLPDSNRGPVSLIFVIDVSGSMNANNGLRIAKMLANDIIEELEQGDEVALVTYGNIARTWHFSPARESGDISNIIQDLRTGGATNVEEGIRAAYRLAGQDSQEGNDVRIVVLSDGVGNIGATGPDTILALIGKQAKKNATLNTLGVGSGGNYNDVMMEILANHGNGVYQYIAGRDEAARFVQENHDSIFQSPAKDARIQVEFNPEVVRKYRLIGYGNRAVADQDFRDDTLDFGEPAFGRDVTALYELRLNDEAAQEAILATARLRWAEPLTGKVKEIEESIRATDLAQNMDSTNPYTLRTAAVAEIAEILRKSYWAQCSEPEAAVELLQKSGRDAGDGAPEARELRDLVLGIMSDMEPHCK